MHSNEEQPAQAPPSEEKEPSTATASSTQITPTLDSLQEWTVQDGGDATWSINTGPFTLEMVTDDYQMACDICSTHNDTFSALALRITELEELIQKA